MADVVFLGFGQTRGFDNKPITQIIAQEVALGEAEVNELGLNSVPPPVTTEAVPFSKAEVYFEGTGPIINVPPVDNPDVVFFVAAEQAGAVVGPVINVDGDPSVVIGPVGQSTAVQNLPINSEHLYPVGFDVPIVTFVPDVGPNPVSVDPATFASWTESVPLSPNVIAGQQNPFPCVPALWVNARHATSTVNAIGLSTASSTPNFRYQTIKFSPQTPTVLLQGVTRTVVAIIDNGVRDPDPAQIYQLVLDSALPATPADTDQFEIITSLGATTSKDDAPFNALAATSATDRVGVSLNNAAPTATDFSTVATFDPDYDGKLIVFTDDTATAALRGFSTSVAGFIITLSIAQILTLDTLPAVPANADQFRIVPKLQRNTPVLEILLG